MNTIEALITVRNEADKRLNVLQRKRDDFAEKNMPEEFKGTFMESSAVVDTPYDDDIKALNNIRLIASTTLNDVERIIKNPEILNPNYDGAPC